MYSPSIIAARLHAAKKSGQKVTRLPREDSIGRALELERLRIDPKTGKPGPTGYLSRPLKKHEEEYILSEQLLCKCDFSYFFQRHFSLEIDAGVGSGSGEITGIGPVPMLESQKRYVTLFGRREEECHAEKKKYGLTRGIRAAIHKSRQVAATATMRGATWHRMLFYSPVRALFATLDEPRVSEVFHRDKVFLDNLRWWLKPTIFPDRTNEELGFPAPLSSRITYQTENANSGFGTGSQNDVSHLTEVALYKYSARINYSFLPSLPNAITTLHVQESTADGKGNYWHETTEAIRKRSPGFEDWVYAFIPWWYNRLKNRAVPPVGWEPNEATLLHAAKVERTSPEFNDGVVYHPTREQLYWWESERARHVRNGELPAFLTNYPADPAESFQAAVMGALPVELIETMSNEAMNPGAWYEYEVGA